MTRSQGRVRKKKKFREDAILMIGGWQDDYFSPKTWIINSKNLSEMIEGPPLKKTRYAPACGKLRDESGNIIIIVAGGLDQVGYEMDSVEILNTTSMKEWKKGLY